MHTTRKLYIYLWAVVFGVAIFLYAEHRTISNNGTLSVEDIQSINLKVNKMIMYGEGPCAKAFNPTEKEILAHGNGHCGMYAYLFCKELSRHGAIGIAYDLRILSYDSPDGHTIVEVETTDGKMVFDPTYGVFYRCDLKKLLVTGNVEDYMVGTPVISSPLQMPYYCSNYFYSRVRSVVCYFDVRDCYDKNVLYDVGVQTSANLFQINRNTLGFISADEMLESNSVFTGFEQETEIYRFNMTFEGQLPTINQIKIIVKDSDGGERICEGWIRKNNNFIEFQFREPQKIISIHIIFPGELKDKMPSLVDYHIFQ